MYSLDAGFVNLMAADNCGSVCVFDFHWITVFALFVIVDCSLIWTRLGADDYVAYRRSFLLDESNLIFTPKLRLEWIGRHLAVLVRTTTFLRFAGFF